MDESIEKENKINPKHTQSFIEHILVKGKEGIYRVEVKVGSFDC